MSLGPGNGLRAGGSVDEVCDRGEKNDEIEEG